MALGQSKTPIVIAIDGPAASGKGTIGKLVAERLGLGYLDTGSLYREVANRAIRLNIDPSDETQLAAIAKRVRPGLIDAVAIRSQAVTQLSPSIAAMPLVRQALLAIQRKFARQGQGAVLDGRDIGTVVCPDADVKLFITASADVRANRRQEELKKRDDRSSYETVLADILARDEHDRNRTTAPLIPASDAVVIDTSVMRIEDAVSAVLDIVGQKI